MQEKPKSYRAKKIEKFLDRWFPYEPMRLPTVLELRNQMLKNQSSGVNNSTKSYPER
jgi:hypothetical protein